MVQPSLLGRSAIGKAIAVAPLPLVGAAAKADGPASPAAVASACCCCSSRKATSRLSSAAFSSASLKRVAVVPLSRPDSAPEAVALSKRSSSWYSSLHAQHMYPPGKMGDTGINDGKSEKHELHAARWLCPHNSV